MSDLAANPPPPYPLQRTEALLGRAVLERLASLRLLVVGLGAVGGACVEALARSGTGALGLVDGDTFEASNLNRQPFASLTTLGIEKSHATAQRLKEIAPSVTTYPETLTVTPENVVALLERMQPTVVVDAIDDLSAKVALLTACVRQELPVWSAMGAARKLDPTAFRITDLSKTQVCPLARALRHELRKVGISKGIRCVWSNEVPQALSAEGALGSYMPATATAGLLLAADIVKWCQDSQPTYSR